MPSNVEIKAKVYDMTKLKQLVAKIATQPKQRLHQEDIFFKSSNGRLKLRMFSDTNGQLIHYDRPNNLGAKLSSYLLYKTSEPILLKELLSKSLDEIVSVIKTREVYIVGQTRVHLDEVEQLGTFMELEVVLEKEQTCKDGEKILSNLKNKLEIDDKDLISVAYADLLINKNGSHR